jgi:hypothetical protein
MDAGLVHEALPEMRGDDCHAAFLLQPVLRF